MSRPTRDDEPSVLGGAASPAPMPTMAEAEDAWRDAFIARMVERGIARADAEAYCEVVDVDFAESPSDSADRDVPALLAEVERLRKLLTDAPLTADAGEGKDG